MVWQALESSLTRVSNSTTSLCNHSTPLVHCQGNTIKPSGSPKRREEVLKKHYPPKSLEIFEDRSLLVYRTRRVFIWLKVCTSQSLWKLAKRYGISWNCQGQERENRYGQFDKAHTANVGFQSQFGSFLCCTWHLFHCITSLYGVTVSLGFFSTFPCSFFRI